MTHRESPAKEQQDARQTVLEVAQPQAQNYKSTCRGCYNLDYGRFWPGVELYAHRIVDNPQPDTHTKYRITSLERIKTAATGGCRWCYIISHGMSSVWKELPEQGNRTAKSWPQGGSCSHFDLHRERLLMTFGSKESFRYTVFLKLAPNRPLRVLRGYDKPQWPAVDLRTAIEFYTEIDHLPAHQAFGHARTVQPHLTLDDCIDDIRRWLRTCNTRHAACSVPARFLPKRLIQVTEGTPRLVETETLDYAPYLTLSHCWGENPAQMIRSTKQNLEKRKCGIDWEELPVVFRDAFSITQAIGHHFIWIDSLCIIQDDEEDWEEEASAMADVYSNSFLNIAATFSSDSYTTLFSDRKHFVEHQAGNFTEEPIHSWQMNDPSTQTDPRLFARKPHQFSHTMFTSQANSRFVAQAEKIAPLLQRAWVFQERLLAPRNIHIGSSELTWECSTALACECGGISHTSIHSADLEGLKPRFALARQNKLPEKQVLDIWHEIVTSYSNLKLTKPSDRIKALHGVASCISRILHCDNIFGIMSTHMSSGLLWFPRGGALTPPGTIPSWSWISRYDPNTSTAKFYHDVETIDYRLQVTPIHPLGALSTPTRLLVKGFVHRGRLIPNQPMCARVRIEAWHNAIYWDLYNRDVAEEKEVLCLLMGTSSMDEMPMMVLEPQEIKGQYRRIGVVRYFEYGGMKIEGGEIREFTLV
ncbi:unnamed protein product [Periconia digitata]|uniref:Heterokaryon incompatibility domain-containing protein n=1 Tax=Periconia digitata TaxID=1303443 RepID=A0A9W4UD81_9PLEO|nr:unnamed protein product [Periconia digitata]